jgi:hypothetical protein
MDSDSSAGNSADSDPPQREKKQPKKVVKKVEKQPEPLPRPKRLTAARRQQIIDDYQRGVFDKEYEVTENKEARTFRVQKRKGLYTPSASVAAVAPSKPTPPPDVTWVKMQKSVNDSLTSEIKSLRDQYDKPADKYQKKKIKKRAKKIFKGPIEGRLPEPALPPGPTDEEVRAAVLHPLPQKNKAACTRNTPIDIRNF